jgi:hypothetical protein
MKCLRCHQDNPSHAKVCLECGTPANSVATSYADLKNELERLMSSLPKRSSSRRRPVEDPAGDLELSDQSPARARRHG